MTQGFDNKKALDTFVMGYFEEKRMKRDWGILEEASSKSMTVIAAGLLGPVVFLKIGNTCHRIVSLEPKEGFGS